MDATEAEKQIEQMCRFIEQEAKEKVDEITMKTDQDHDKEEQTLLVEGRINLKAEFEKKMKELSVRKRMYVKSFLSLVSPPVGLCVDLCLIARERVKTLFTSICCVPECCLCCVSRGASCRR